jgi:hypothetical protein
MNWKLSDRADREALPIADRHYNRQKSRLSAVRPARKMSGSALRFWCSSVGYVMAVC